MLTVDSRTGAVVGIVGYMFGTSLQAKVGGSGLWKLRGPGFCIPRTVCMEVLHSPCPSKPMWLFKEHKEAGLCLHQD